MGIRAGVVVCTTSFLLGELKQQRKVSDYSYFSPGALFTNWIADSVTLWKSPITDEHLWTAASYYSILAKAPQELLYFLGCITLLGGTTILWSLRDGEAGNLMFDGGSLCTCIFSLTPKHILTRALSPVRFDHGHVLVLGVTQYAFSPKMMNTDLLNHSLYRHLREVCFASNTRTQGPHPQQPTHRCPRPGVEQPHLQRRSDRRPRTPGRPLLGG